MKAKRVSIPCAAVLTFASTFLLSAHVGMAQQECGDVNITEVGSWNQDPDPFGYADVWGDGDIAYVGQGLCSMNTLGTENSPDVEGMSWKSPLLGKSISCAVRLPDSTSKKKPVVVYLKNLPGPRLGELDNRVALGVGKQPCRGHGSRVCRDGDL